MRFAMLYAHWKDFGEKWSTPSSWETELVGLGHKVDVFNLYHRNGEFDQKKKTRFYSDEGVNSLKAAIDSGIHYDAIYILDYGPYQTLKLSREYFPNSVLIKEAGDEPQSHRMHLQTAKQFDLVLSPDRECVAHYKTLGINAVWQPHFADQRIFYPRPEISESFDCVTTCGPRGNGLTEEIAKAIPGFNNERYFYGEDHAKRLCMGKMVFQKSQFGEITRRVFEGMACGKMVITDRLSDAKGLHELFEDGVDIVYYDNADDAIDKIRFYSEHESERAKIAQSGFNKVSCSHTVSARTNELLSILRREFDRDFDS